jgi:enoyl-CoA hydratase/carnithine racemase
MSFFTEHNGQRSGVTVLELNRPPHNHLNVDLLESLADSLERLDNDNNCRAIVLAAAGKVFSAGADFSPAGGGAANDTASFYAHAMRLFRSRKPLVAAVQGAAVGAGLGLALAADFRVTCPEARFCANFTRLGFHPGFGISVTLPRLVGEQQAALLLYTGQRIDGEQAQHIGLADVLVPAERLREAALDLAGEIAASAPLAVESTRETLRLGLAERVRIANERELEIQREQFATEDFKEGVAAMAQRRLPSFTRR